MNYDTPVIWKSADQALLSLDTNQKLCKLYGLREEEIDILERGVW